MNMFFKGREERRNKKSILLDRPLPAFFLNIESMMQEAVEKAAAHAGKRIAMATHTEGAFLQYHKKYEKMLVPILKLYFRKQRQHVMQHVPKMLLPLQVKGGEGSGVRGNTTEHEHNIHKFIHKKSFIKTTNISTEGWAFNKEEWDAQLKNDLDGFMKQLVSEYGPQVVQQLKYGVPELQMAFDVKNPNVEQWMDNYTSDLADEINKTTLDAIESAVADGLDEGYSNSVIAANISNVYDDCEDWRADMIARTETSRAMNEASNMTYIQSGVVKQKEWLVTEDDRTCPECLAMDGAIVDLEDTFTDASAPAQSEEEQQAANEVTESDGINCPPLHPNCRCCLVPIVMDEDEMEATGGGVPVDEELAAEQQETVPPQEEPPVQQEEEPQVQESAGTEEVQGLVANAEQAQWQELLDKCIQYDVRPPWLVDMPAINQEAISSGVLAHNEQALRSIGVEYSDLRYIETATLRVLFDLVNTLPEGTIKDIVPAGDFCLKGAFPILGKDQMFVLSNEGSLFYDPFKMANRTAYYDTVRTDNTHGKVAFQTNSVRGDFYRAVGAQKYRPLFSLEEDSFGNFSYTHPDISRYITSQAANARAYLLADAPSDFISLVGKNLAQDEMKFFTEQYATAKLIANAKKLGIATEENITAMKTRWLDSLDKMGVKKLPEFFEKYETFLTDKKAAAKFVKEVESPELVKARRPRKVKPSDVVTADGAPIDSFQVKPLKDNMTNEEITKAHTKLKRLLYPKDLNDFSQLVNNKREVQDKLYARLENNKDYIQACTWLRDKGWMPAPSGEVTEIMHENKRAIDSLVHEWAITSGDEHPVSIAMQIAAKEEFNLTSAQLEHFDANLIDANRIYDGCGAGLRAFLRAQYDETQLFLKENGITHIPLARGYVEKDPDKASVLYNMFTGESKSKTVPTQMQPMSSFSAMTETAAGFSSSITRQSSMGMMLGADIPRERILSTVRTGFGCTNETEYVVLGSIDTMNVMTYARFVNSNRYENFLKMIRNIMLKAFASTAESFADINTPLMLDVQIDNADWTKMTWDLPPYLSPEFNALVPHDKLDDFKKLPVYLNALASGEIVDNISGGKSFTKGGEGSGVRGHTTPHAELKDRGNWGHAGRPGEVGGSARSQASEGTKINEYGSLVCANGKPLPDHIEKLGIPVAWQNIRFNPDPKGECLVAADDAKGRPQSIYSKEHDDRKALEKFARVMELNDKFNQVRKQIDSDIKNGDSKLREHAECEKLIISTGIRPGSERNTQAERQAYGATTLLGSHVVTDDKGNVSLQFVGKKGVDLTIPIVDKDVQRMIVARAASAGPDGQLFKSVSANSLLDYTKNLDGGGFLTKDLRTVNGTREAIEAIKKISAPSDEKEYNKAVHEVAVRVSDKLGNTPVVAMQKYINPAVFAKWRIRAGVGESSEKYFGVIEQKGDVGSGIRGHRTDRDKPSSDNVHINAKASAMSGLKKNFGVTEKDIKELFNHGSKFDVDVRVRTNPTTFGPSKEPYYSLEAVARAKGGVEVCTDIYFKTDKSDVHLDLMTIDSKNNAQQGKDIGSKFMERLETFTTKIGKDEISLLVDISIGKYAWARMGFDCQTPNELRVMKENFVNWGYDYLNKINAVDSHEKFESMVKPISDMKGIADFNFMNIHDTKSRYGVVNNDVKNDLKMHMGKAFLLDSMSHGGHGAWDGKKPIKKGQ